ncbi:MAG: hypothetical protein ABI333_17855 [bacterium]
MTKAKKMIVALALVSAVGAVSAGCYVAVDDPATPAVHTNYYQPQYYNGYVVYYTDAGLPYYYYNGAVIYVPRTYAGYNGYYSHWYSNRVHYRRWYNHRGHRYRRYNRRTNRGTRRHNRAVRRGGGRGKSHRR